MLVNPIPKIRIKSCSDALLWYNKRIGDVFEIYEFEMPYAADFQSASLQNILDKAAIVDLALEFNLSVSLGDYGYRRSLVLDDEDYNGYTRGAWVSSSADC